MQKTHQLVLCASVALVLIVALKLSAQNSPSAQTPPAGEQLPTFGGAAGAFPSRPKGNPESIARGKVSYNTNCAYCHGEDARGGENGGTNLLRSDYVMKDKFGEVLGPFLKDGVPEKGMPKFNVSDPEVADIAAFIHSFLLSSRDPGRIRPKTVLVGDAKAGETYFKTKCAQCHSVTGDLKGIATRIDDSRSLQQTWLMPTVFGGRGAIPSRPDAKPVTVTVTFEDGKKVEGKLGRIDDFIVTLTEADGTPRTIRRDGDSPKVEVNNPMKPHWDLLTQYSDRDIHNVTAYLATIK
jgi:cytochrome c oxidase cbb3-type subunit III